MTYPIVRKMSSRISDNEYHYMCKLFGHSGFSTSMTLDTEIESFEKFPAESIITHRTYTLHIHKYITPHMLTLVDLLLSERIVQL